MAITRAQQAKQMLQDGGMLVKPGFGGKRQGYRGDAAAASAAASGNMGGRSDPGPQGSVGDDFDRGSFRDAVRRGELRNITNRIEQEKIEEKLEPFRELGSTQRKFTNKLSKLPIPKFLSRFGPLNTRDFLIEKALSATNSPMTKEQFANLTLEQQNRLLSDYTKARNAGEMDAYFNPIERRGEGINQILPVDTTFAQAPSTTEQEPELSPFEKALADRTPYRFAADGGIMNDDVVGGEFDFESARQMYGLGKLVKKVTRTVKKIAKSPVGKAAIVAATYKLGGGKRFGFGGEGFKFSNLPGLGFLKPASSSIKAAAAAAGLTPREYMMGMGGKTATGGGIFSMIPGGKVGAGILGLSALAGLTTPEEEEQDGEDTTYRGEGLDIEAIRANPFAYSAPRFLAEGGSTEKEPVAKKTMPLLDMGGKEKDYRETGGFVDMGRMEKADDVPARLSKNEFVFTADAVRNAGDGNVDKGAEVMYNMMKNLEAGGDVSEESQGLEGARKMFQTSQRLEEVL